MRSELDRRSPARRRRAPSTDTRACDDAAPGRVFFAASAQHGARDTVGRFLDRVVADDVEVVEQRPGRHARLYDEADCTDSPAHAVVVLNRDDGQAGAEAQNSTEAERLHAVFGFLCCALGPAHVTVLHHSSARYPAEPDGFCRSPLDDRAGWQLDLLADLQSSGIPVRLDRVAGLAS